MVDTNDIKFNRNSITLRFDSVHTSEYYGTEARYSAKETERRAHAIYSLLGGMNPLRGGYTFSQSDYDAIQALKPKLEDIIRQASEILEAKKGV